MRVLKKLNIVKIPKKYLLLRWSAIARKYIYSGGFIFRNHINKSTYQISTQAQGNELAKQYMLAAMKDMVKNIYLMGRLKIISSLEIGRVVAFEMQNLKIQGISNTKLKGY
ncbi:hypothetical protein MA16_Dca017408 [Dendrobium catenatum]|uniref:Uncharacterized protein n=1 Tax=Dendrobium catenatum TaxID=906689 RepID=A0A2I0X0E1_9ASPA|nr:hypothetical protein MA16_Dca017408 [Dendrobium catenatum]